MYEDVNAVGRPLLQLGYTSIEFHKDNAHFYLVWSQSSTTSINMIYMDVYKTSRSKIYQESFPKSKSERANV